jgi:hypothetical protein
MQKVEIMKYLGIGYRELRELPADLYKTTIIRMEEEAAYSKYVNKKK